MHARFAVLWMMTTDDTADGTTSMSIEVGVCFNFNHVFILRTKKKPGYQTRTVRDLRRHACHSIGSRPMYGSAESETLEEEDDGNELCCHESHVGPLLSHLVCTARCLHFWSSIHSKTQRALLQLTSLLWRMQQVA
jgi:hypothetical protein